MPTVPGPIDWSSALTNDGYGTGDAAPRRRPGLPGPIDWSRVGRHPTSEEMEADERARARVGIPHVAPGELNISSLDRYIRPPGASEYFQLRKVFGALRNAGVAPHGTFQNPDGLTEDQMDELVGDLLIQAVETLSTGATEEGVTPSALLALDEGTFPHVDPTDAGVQKPAITKVGTYIEMVADMARMGAGRIRRVRQCDIYWASLFPYGGEAATIVQDNFDGYGALVPKPSTVLATLYADDHAALGWSTGLIVACLCMGVKVDLTPFNAGGGASQNFGEGDAREHSDDLMPLDGNEDTGVVWASLYDYRPAWQAGLLVPSGEGWDPWYIEALDPLADPRGYPYHQYVINVWPISEAEAVASGVAYDPNTATCARRKCMGVLAFTSGIAAWLEKINLAFQTLGFSLYEVVDTIELCNETTGFFYTAGTPPTPASIDLTLLGASVHEAGRYFALLAGPIRSKLRAMRFRTEIGSWGADTTEGTAPPLPDQYASRLYWLENVLAKGIPDEVDRWHALAAERALWAAGGSVSAEAAAWFEDEVSGGLTLPRSGTPAWPPVARGIPAAADLVHQVGTHWFHDSNVDTRNSPAPWNYADAVRLRDDVLALRSMIAGSNLTSLGYHLEPVIMAMNFPAVDPGEPKDPLNWKRYEFTDAYLQAAMLVRSTCTALASGVASVGVFNFAAGFIGAGAPLGHSPAFQSFQSFASDGVRNDILYDSSPPELGKGPDRYSQRVDCWPRPAWYTLRRLIWLYAQLGLHPRLRLRVLESTLGLTVLGFQFATPLHVGPDGEPLANGPCSRGYLICLDQHATNPGAHAPGERRVDPWATLTFSDPNHRSLLGDPASFYTSLSLVPELDYFRRSTIGYGPRAGADRVDGNGYASERSLEWNWLDYDSALVWSILFEGNLLTRIGACTPTASAAPAYHRYDAIPPVILLTNLIYVGSS